MKLNNANQVEAIDITITKEKYPIVFENKVQELMEDCGMTREEAEAEVEGMVIECEIYYHKSCGLWATEQGHVESGVVYDPYDGEVCEEPDDDEEQNSNSLVFIIKTNRNARCETRFKPCVL